MAEEMDKITGYALKTNINNPFEKNNEISAKQQKINDYFQKYGLTKEQSENIKKVEEGKSTFFPFLKDTDQAINNMQYLIDYYVNGTDKLFESLYCCGKYYAIMLQVVTHSKLLESENAFNMFIELFNNYQKYRDKNFKQSSEDEKILKEIQDDEILDGLLSAFGIESKKWNIYIEKTSKDLNINKQKKTLTDIFDTFNKLIDLTETIITFFDKKKYKKLTDLIVQLIYVACIEYILELFENTISVKENGKKTIDPNIKKELKKILTVFDNIIKLSYGCDSSENIYDVFELKKISKLLNKFLKCINYNDMIQILFTSKSILTNQFDINSIIELKDFSKQLKAIDEFENLSKQIDSFENKSYLEKDTDQKKSEQTGMFIKEIKHTMCSDCSILSKFVVLFGNVQINDGLLKFIDQIFEYVSKNIANVSFQSQKQIETLNFQIMRDFIKTLKNISFKLLEAPNKLKLPETMEDCLSLFRQQDKNKLKDNNEKKYTYEYLKPFIEYQHNDGIFDFSFLNSDSATDSTQTMSLTNILDSSIQLVKTGELNVTEDFISQFKNNMLNIGTGSKKGIQNDAYDLYKEMGINPLYGELLKYLNSSNYVKTKILDQSSDNQKNSETQLNSNLLNSILKQSDSNNDQIQEDAKILFSSVQDNDLLQELIKQFMNQNATDSKISQLEINNIVNYFQKNMDYFVLNNRLNNLKQLFEVH